MIDLTIHSEGLARNAARARERGLLLPTFEQMIDHAARLVERGLGIGLLETGDRRTPAQPLAATDGEEARGEATDDGDTSEDGERPLGAAQLTIFSRPSQ